jgi:hypothetical protein
VLRFEGFPDIGDKRLYYLISVPVGTPYTVIQRQLDHEHDRLSNWAFFLSKPWGFYRNVSETVKYSWHAHYNNINLLHQFNRAHNRHGVFRHSRQSIIDGLKTCTSETWICLRGSQYNFDETPPFNSFRLQLPTLYKDEIVFTYYAASVNPSSLTDVIPISSDDEHIIRVVLLEKKRLFIRKRLMRFGALLAFSSFIFALNSILDTYDLQQLVYVTSFAGLTIGMVAYVLNIVTKSLCTDMSRKCSKHTPRSKKEETVERPARRQMARVSGVSWQDPPREEIPWKTTW